ncbi:MAG: hypothetical protein ACUVSQ_03670 [Pseudanabaenaceae cyanobacterium]
MNPFPLFHERLLRQQMAAFAFPSNLISRYEHWRELGEPPATPAFWQGLFESVLGYDETTWGWEPTPHLGHLADISLDRVPPLVGPPWAIALSGVGIQLYRRDRGWLLHWEMPLAALTTLEHLQALYFVLGRRTFLPMREGLSSRVEQLWRASEDCWQEQLRGLTRAWRQLQTQLVRDFRHRLRQEPDSENLAVGAARLLMYRALWIGWAEAWGLLPAGLLADAYHFVNPYRRQPVWENFQAVFRWLERGYPPLERLGLPWFAWDDRLDGQLFLGDELCRQVHELAKHPFREDVPLAAIAALLSESRPHYPAKAVRDREGKYWPGASRNEPGSIRNIPEAITAIWERQQGRIPRCHELLSMPATLLLALYLVGEVLQQNPPQPQIAFREAWQAWVCA